MEKPIKPDLEKLINPEHRKHPDGKRVLTNIDTFISKIEGLIDSVKHDAVRPTRIPKISTEDIIALEVFSDLFAAINKYADEISAYNMFKNLTEPEKLYPAAVQILAGYRAEGNGMNSVYVAKRAIADARQIALELCTIEVDN